MRLARPRTWINLRQAGDVYDTTEWPELLVTPGLRAFYEAAGGDIDNTYNLLTKVPAGG